MFEAAPALRKCPRNVRSRHYRCALPANTEYKIDEQEGAVGQPPQAELTWVGQRPSATQPALPCVAGAGGHPLMVTLQRKRRLKLVSHQVSESRPREPSTGRPRVHQPSLPLAPTIRCHQSWSTCWVFRPHSTPEGTETGPRRGSCGRKKGWLREEERTEFVLKLLRRFLDPLPGSPAPPLPPAPTNSFQTCQSHALRARLASQAGFCGQTPTLLSL